MKIHNDFVSNSSSSSFIIFGKTFTLNEFIKAFKKKLKDIDIDDCSFWDILDEIDEVLIDNDLSYVLDDNCSNDIALGIELRDADEKMSIKRLKSLAASKLRKAGFKLKNEDIDILRGVRNTAGEIEWD